MTDSPGGPALVLMYHRVTEPGFDPWSLCVSPAHFSEQLEALRSNARPVPLQQLAIAASGDQTCAPSQRVVAVTFDDGYADNLLHARPQLERFDVPATVFVTSGAVGARREFWWDELEGLLLSPGTLPASLRLGVDGSNHEWQLGEAASYSQEDWQLHRLWKAPENPPTPRHALFVTLWTLLQPLAESKQHYLLNTLRAWTGAEPRVREAHRALSVAELRTLASSERVEIGAHCVTHPVLKGLPIAVQRGEIQRSKARLEDLLGMQVASFAYPYGAYDDETVPLVREAGFTCACSTVESAVSPGCDPLQLPRFQVEDWDGDQFAKQLSRWLGA